MRKAVYWLIILFGIIAAVLVLSTAYTGFNRIGFVLHRNLALYSIVFVFLHIALIIYQRIKR